jgi:hypothetical protein
LEALAAFATMAASELSPKAQWIHVPALPGDHYGKLTMYRRSSEKSSIEAA